MDSLFSFLQSVNVIAIVAFFLTTIFLGYEVYLLVYQKKQADKPLIPDFQVDISYGKPKENLANIEVVDEKRVVKFPHERMIVLLVVIMIIFGVVSLMGIFNKIDTQTTELSQNRVKTKVLQSPGIKIYNGSWVEMKDTDIRALKPGDLIIVSIAGIAGVSEIDGARIKVNRTSWEVADPNIVFDKQRNLYYKEYKILPTDAKLTVDAQLHSKVAGWLGNNEKK